MPLIDYLGIIMSPAATPAVGDIPTRGVSGGWTTVPAGTNNQYFVGTTGAPPRWINGIYPDGSAGTYSPGDVPSWNGSAFAPSTPTTPTGSQGVKLATQAPLPSNTYSSSVLTATTNGALSIDSTPVTVNSKVLVKDEVDATHNGLYVVTATGDAGTPYVLTRDSTTLKTGFSVSVAQGSTQAGTQWVLTSTVDNYVPGTSSLSFTHFVGSGAATNSQNIFTKRQRIAPQTRVGTNLQPQPRLGMGPIVYTSDRCTSTQVTDIADPFGGSNKIHKATCTSVGVTDCYSNSTTARIAAVPGNIFTISGWMYKGAANTTDGGGSLGVQVMNSVGTVIATYMSTEVTYAKGVWQRFSFTTPVMPANTAFIRFFGEAMGNHNAAIGDIFYYDGVLIEQTSTLGSYFDGSYPAASWSGTAYNSSSSVAGEDSFIQYRDVNNVTTLAQVDANAKAWFQGVDASSQRITSLANATTTTDALPKGQADSLYTGTTIQNTFSRKQRLSTRPSGTNQCTNPRPGLGAIWSSDHTAGMTQVTDIADAFGGANKVAKATLTSVGASDLYFSTRQAVTPGDTWTFSFYTYAAVTNAADRHALLQVTWYNGSGVSIGNIASTAVVVTRGVWTRISLTATVPAGAATALIIHEGCSDNAPIGEIFYYDGLLWEKNVSSLYPYFDGSVINGVWTGTAYQSTSTYTGDTNQIEGTGPMGTYVNWHVDALFKLWAQGVDSGGQKITSVGDATADTDALNRRTADARYSVSVPTPTSSLPSKIYAQSGRELGVYWDAFLDSGLNLTNYRFDVTCTKGEQDEYRWFFTPVDADAGTYSWTLDVYYNYVKIATYTTSLVVTASSAASGVSRKMVAIGDSTTALGNGAVWLAELQNLLVGDVMSVTQVGSISGNATDSGGNSRTVHNDAVSGKTINYFYTDPASPFVNSGAFDFAHYLTANTITLSANDWVFIHLGINDIFSYTDDASVNTQITTMLTQLNAMITNIKAAVSGIRIGLLMTIPPSSTQDAFGVNYTAGQTQWRYKRNRDMWCEAMRLNFSDTTVANVFALPVHVNIDTRNNFPTSNVALNSRNSTTYAKVNNGVHPAPLGFYQMADSVYSFLKAFA